MRHHTASTLLVALFTACGCVGAPPDEPEGSAASPVLVSTDGGAVSVFNCYRDDDGDGIGTGGAVGTAATSCGAGLAAVRGDCDDGDATKQGYFSCYRDADGDHWGAGSRASLCASSTCWSSDVADVGGDADDANAAVHPERSETAGDGLDNDQDGAVDETEMSFSRSGNNNTTTGFDVAATLNASSIYDMGTLYARVTWRALEDSATAHVGALTAVSHTAGSRGVTLSVTGLAAHDGGAVYSATVRFYARSVSPTGVVTYAAVGPGSDTYYTMTRPSSSAASAAARWNIVMRALEDWDDSEKGAIHEWETGWRTTRYGATTNAAWCTEFYVTMAKGDLYRMNTESEASGDHVENDTGDMQTWFGGYGSMLVARPTDAELADRAPGTWLGVDTDGDGDENHTEMLLAWDATAATPTYWAVAGNTTGNAGGAYLGSGHGDRVGVWSHSTATSTGGRRVLDAGRIHTSAMLDP